MPATTPGRGDPRASPAAEPHGERGQPEGRARTIAAFGEPLTPQQVVERICADVQCRGLDAVLDYTARLDGVTLDPSAVRVSADELADGLPGGRPGLSADDPPGPRQRPGVPVGHPQPRRASCGAGRAASCGCAIGRCGGSASASPAGRRRIPSSLLMTVVPAQAAGVEEIAVVVPPTPFGGYNTDLLAACHALGVTEVHRIGGAQAVAALAYGVDGIAGGRQDRRAGQPVRRPGQAAGLRRGRHRQHRRAERGRPDRRLDGRPALRRRRPDQPGRALARAPAS